MRSRLRIPALVAGALAAPGPASAALSQDSFLLRNAGDLVELCSAPQTDPLYTAAVNFCHGFAVGVYRVLNEEEAAHKSRHLFCVPEATPSRSDGIAMYVQWANANPAQLSQPPADSLALFLSERFPCPGATSSRRAVP